MPKINVLPKHIAELIAAGEVVERPASVIKELMENSIDAGSTSITVEIKHGGITYIRITDNGCGIEREDVPKAFMSHATSKISVSDDLSSIGTLGFRGEALASVAAVSKTEIMTKVQSEQIGTRCVVIGSEQTELDDAGCPQGTTIVVRDLFFNTPARMKFLKKDVTEGNAVAGVVDRLALSHPEISIRFIRDGKESLLTPGDGKLDSAIYAVFGKEFSQGIIKSEYE
ncbi:MAG: DNA mismatch repair endonuclease MutL, partial [Oscillospiraceae bacterium]